MAIQWTNDLATGVQAIDDRDKELLSRVNLLFNACNIGKGRIEVGKTIQFLEDYVNEHFSTEERHVISHQYPDHAAHKAQHLSFIDNLAKIRQLAKEGPGINIILLMNRLIIDWLRGHIRMLDGDLETTCRTGRNWPTNLPRTSNSSCYVGGAGRHA